MSLNIFIIGPSGCGKSTQAKLIADKYNLIHLSMGQLLRDQIAAGSEDGLEAKKYIDEGSLVPEELTFKILTNKLKEVNNQAFIIDGFPRTLDQGTFIEGYLADQKQPLDMIIHLDVTFEEIKARRAKRGDDFQDKDRTDNTPQAITARQKFYDDNNNQIMDYFQAKDLLFRIDGNRPIEPIFDDIMLKVDKLS
jgi:adenylate kinase